LTEQDKAEGDKAQKPAEEGGLTPTNLCTGHWRRSLFYFLPAVAFWTESTLFSRLRDPTMRHEYVRGTED
jgi:hypothetical protein